MLCHATRDLAHLYRREIVEEEDAGQVVLHGDVRLPEVLCHRVLVGVDGVVPNIRVDGGDHLCDSRPLRHCVS